MLQFYKGKKEQTHAKRERKGKNKETPKYKFETCLKKLG